ncbi:hypothetical protein Salat_0686700 [Sesamum alatum]|uniref:Uncharacterized protein n=1 Tax=Sesamum alatum TaxID=300844 RepID=A0AAE1YS37_9LAMI|nr:hypothetical protein Salat_0686700 [Sesamum alatum]
MCKAVNKGDIESLSGRSMESLGHLLLSQVVMVFFLAQDSRHYGGYDRETKMRANLEAALSRLKGARAQVEDLKKRVSEGESKFQEDVTVLRSQIEEKDQNLAMQAIEMESLCTTSLQSYTKGSGRRFVS